MVPDIDGQLHHFTNAGLYDGLFTLYDAESKTLWIHITGEAEYGPLVGRSLGPSENQLQINVKQALEMDPKTAIAISDRCILPAAANSGRPRESGAEGADRAAEFPTPTRR